MGVEQAAGGCGVAHKARGDGCGRREAQDHKSRRAQGGAGAEESGQGLDALQPGQRADIVRPGGEAGRGALNILYSAGAEAAEEIIAGIADPALKSIYDGQSLSSHYSPETAADILHDALVGGILGGVGGSVAAITRRGAPAGATNDGEALDNAATARPEPQAGADTHAAESGAQGVSGTQNAVPKAETAIADYQRQTRYGATLNEVRAHLPEIENNMPVATITGSEFQKTAGDSRSLRVKAIEFFNSLGNKVFRDGMGDIELNDAGARDSLAHGYGKLKAATFAALPNVLKNGTLISTKGPYEGHHYDS